MTTERLMASEPAIPGSPERTDLGPSDECAEIKKA